MHFCWVLLVRTFINKQFCFTNVIMICSFWGSYYVPSNLWSTEQFWQALRWQVQIVSNDLEIKQIQQTMLSFINYIVEKSQRQTGSNKQVNKFHILFQFSSNHKFSWIDHKLAWPSSHLLVEFYKLRQSLLLNAIHCDKMFLVCLLLLYFILFLFKLRTW